MISDPRLPASVYTDEKLLPLAAELQSVPDIDIKPSRNKSNTDENFDAGNTSALESMVANLSAGEKQILAKMLRQARVG